MAQALDPSEPRVSTLLTIAYVTEAPIRVLINVRVRPEAKAKMEALALKLDMTLSDIARLAMAKGLPLVEKDLQS